MATIAELQAILDAAIAAKAAFLPKYDEVTNRIQIARANGNVTAALIAEKNAVDAEYQALTTAVYKANENLKIAVDANRAQPVDSSGQIVQDDQGSKTSPSPSGVGSNNPNYTAPGPAQNIAINNDGVLVPTGRISGTNAVEPPTSAAGDVNANIDGPTLSIEDSQSTAETQRLLNQNAAATPVAANTPGVGASTNSDAPKNTAQTTADTLFNTPITAKVNRLDGYASYVYSASVYMMDSASYNTFMASSQKNLSSAQLLFQTGGAPLAARNKYFQLDYYLDNIEIECLVTGKGSGTIHNAYRLSMTIIEPNGITLVDNLDRATTDYIFKGDVNRKKAEWSNQNYMLAIRFYGYDANGNKIVGGKAGSTDPNSFIEKFIGFNITNLTFKVGGKTTEYTLEAITPSTFLPTASHRAVIPFNVEFAAQSLKSALGETVTTTTSSTVDASGRETTAAAAVTTTPPPSANAAQTKKDTVTKSLVDALNQYQLDQVKNKQQLIPDKYEIMFADPAIANSPIKPVVGVDKDGAPMSKPTTAQQTLDKATQSTDTTSNTLNATAGMPVIQFIEQVVRNSAFIQSQAKVTTDQNGKQLPNPTPANTVSWYHVNMAAIQGAWDSQRGDYAYTFRYVITPYYITGTPSSYFPDSDFRGVHKRYYYWFTGQNTQVLSYEQTYNTSFIMVMTGGPTVENTSSNYQYLIRRANLPASNASRQGGSVNNPRQYEPGANMASYLYNPGDLAASTMTIIGDPAWIFQGEVANTPTSTSWVPDPFLADDTINPESGQIYYEIVFNAPSDYELATGILNPNKNNIGYDPANKKPGEPLQSYIYMATRVVNMFKQGKFTQELEGVLYMYDPTSKNANKSAAQTTDTQTNADVTQTLRQSNIGNIAATIGNATSGNTVVVSSVAQPNVPDPLLQGPLDA